MYGFLVGADDRWEYLVAGDPLRQIGEAEPEAKQGEVILSPEAWELTSTDFLAAKTPKVSGNHMLQSSTPRRTVLCTVLCYVCQSAQLECYNVGVLCVRMSACIIGEDSSA